VTAFVLKLKRTPPERCDLSGLTPARLAALGHAVERLDIGTTRRPLLVADLFDVRAGDPENIVIEGGSPRFDNVGAELASGAIRVIGDVGQQAGRGMRGGTLVVAGGAGRLAGAGMRGGSIAISGDAGDLAGGPLPGEAAGMRGGALIIRGRAGGRLGDRMRRGLIVAEGGAGDAPASRMLGGTIACFGPVGTNAGALMRRGTLILADSAAECGPTFVDSGRHELVALRLIARWLAAAGIDAAGRLPGRSRRLIGDTAIDGKGEILLPA
jgi:formylmethanofuran dehydrogenase subunit C